MGIVTQPDGTEVIVSDPAPQTTAEIEGGPVTAAPAPVYNAVLESKGGAQFDVFVPDLIPRSRTLVHDGHDYYHIGDAPDGRWIYREQG